MPDKAFECIKSVKAMPEYHLHVCYEGGREIVVDAKWMTKHLSDFFDQLIDPEYFAEVRTDGIGLEWPNGQSLGPYTLEEKGIPIASGSVDIHN